MLHRRAVYALVVVALVAGCTSGAKRDGGYRFSSATEAGQLISSDQRRPVAAVGGTLIDGGSFALATDAGRVVVLNFWASWCPPCRTETPQFDALYREVHGQGIDFVGIDTKEVSRTGGETFIADNHISYPIVWDEPGKTALALGHIPSGNLPFTVLIDKRQRVAAVYLQTLSPADLRPALAALVAES